MNDRSVAEESADAVDRAQWERVLGEVGARALSGFAASYLELLPERLDAVESAIAAGSGVDAVRTMADLRTSSAMLGAWRLAALVAGAQAELGTVRGRGRPAAVRALRREARAVDRALRSAVAELPGGGNDRPGQLRSESPPPKR